MARNSSLVTHHSSLYTFFFLTLSLLLSACGAAFSPPVATERPTITPTFTVTASRTPSLKATPTVTPTPIPASPTGGPSPTPLFGPTRTRSPNDPTPTRVVNPNAPRIEFFTSDALAVEPGGSITLYWSTRGVQNAVIYRLDSRGERTEVSNVGPDGSMTVTTRRSERGQVDFLLVVGDGSLQTEQQLSIPLACPITWFFQPAPDACPNEEAQPTTLVEQPFERGRMVYIGERDTVYALFNDGREPTWVAVENRYDPAIHPEQDEAFNQTLPPGSYQPIAILGYVWRNSDTVRNRLGVGTSPELSFDGFMQTVSTTGGAVDLYVSSADGTVIKLLPGGDGWQIITPP